MSRAYKATLPLPATQDAPAGDVAQAAADLGDDLSPQPFPVECLPGAAGDMAWAITQAERVPESLTGCCVLGILSASIGAGLQVRSGAQRVTRGNLYLLPSADSGTGKSESVRHAAMPMYAFENELVDRWKATTLPILQAEQDSLESELNQAKKDIARAETSLDRDEIRHRMEKVRARLNELEQELHSPVLVTEDVTSERLASLLEKRGECLASISSDAGKAIQNVLGRYTEGRMDDNLLLKAYSGDPARVDRVGRPSTMLNRPCLSLLWLVQPDKVETLLGERSLADGGLIPRLLICHSNAQPSYITPDHQTGISGEVQSAYGTLIRDLLQTYRLATETRTVEPEQRAMQLLNDYHNAIVDRRKSDLKDVTSYAARWTEQAWRLSVVLHAAQHGAQAHEHKLSFETARDAITLADWYAVQQLEILSGGRWRAKRDRQKEVLFLLADITEGITARDVYRARIAKTAEEARDLLKQMEQDGILEGKDNAPERGGWTVRSYTRKVAR